MCGQVVECQASGSNAVFLIFSFLSLYLSMCLIVSNSVNDYVCMSGSVFEYVSLCISVCPVLLLSVSGSMF